LESPGHSFKLPEGWGVPAAFDQTEKIDGNTQEFRKFFLRFI